MLFNSVTYLLFLAIVVGLYWVLPQRPRLWLIFISSCIFYGFWRFEFIPLMLFSALMDYYLALWIEATEEILPPNAGVPKTKPGLDAVNDTPAVMSSPPIVSVPIFPRGMRGAKAGRVRLRPVGLFGSV